ncbi:uncharacterized protein LOC112344194 [Selaginella moellendorffii]|uniref:uncharacterized protein LOC112344194 n=1 Tax=Selaginella moellendorffii TaxID=88036 RepID=UPI000D1C4802|nr:uncharacterized protein LOC112344194 [Selaginella moellendorffii]|eukprot:XP_024524269.1 uncharacterized protein LOC112344194 [Selaginella moellendorffii]
MDIYSSLSFGDTTKDLQLLFDITALSHASIWMRPVSSAYTEVIAAVAPTELEHVHMFVASTTELERVHMLSISGFDPADVLIIEGEWLSFSLMERFTRLRSPVFKDSKNGVYSNCHHLKKLGVLEMKILGIQQRNGSAIINVIEELMKRCPLLKFVGSSAAPREGLDPQRAQRRFELERDFQIKLASLEARYSARFCLDIDL